VQTITTSKERQVADYPFLPFLGASANDCFPMMLLP
jgi:hypothetical protein